MQLSPNQKSLFGIKTYPELSVISTYTSAGIESYVPHLLFQWWETLYVQIRVKGSSLTSDVVGRFDLSPGYPVASVAVSKALCSARDKDRVY